MKTYAFELSGEHSTLPKSEVLALAGIYSGSFKELASLDQCLLAQAKGLHLAALGRRLAMTHRILEVMAVSSASLEAVEKAALEMNVVDSSARPTYRIRAHRIKLSPLPADRVERTVGRALFSRGYKADMKNPDVDLRAIVTGDKVIMGREVARIDRGGFESRRPHLKPFFHPGALMPRMARALVNLSQAREGQVLLDPFSGTAGILVEACLMDIRGLGVDFEAEMVRGAKDNLEGLDCCLIRGDAKHLPLNDKSIDCSVLDIPYGRSAAIRAASKEALLEKSLPEIYRVLRPGRRMVIVADRPLEGEISKAGFDLLERHHERVHRSLTRHILVCRTAA